MQHPFQLVPELPTLQPPAQASTYQWVQGAAPQGNMESAGQILTVHYPPGQYGNVIGVSQDTPRTVMPQDIAATCHPMFQDAVHPEHPASNNMHQSFPVGRSACYHLSTIFVQQPPYADYRSIPPMQITGRIPYPGLTQIYPVPPSPYKYIRQHRTSWAPQYVQQSMPIIQQVAPCHIYPTGSNWTNVVPQLTEPMHRPRASQWAGPSPLPAVQALQQQQTQNPCTTTEESRQLPRTRQCAGPTPMNAVETPQQSLILIHGTTTAEKNKSSKVSPVIPPDQDMNVSGSVVPHTTTLDDTTLYFNWTSTQIQMDPQNNANCTKTILSSVTCRDITVLSCDTLQLSDVTERLDPSEQLSMYPNMLVSTKSGLISSKQTNQDNAQWQFRDHCFGPESLPKDLTSCTYDDPLVSALVSSMDHFYSVSTYGVLPSEEETGSNSLLARKTMYRENNKNTSSLSHPIKKNLALLESQNHK